MHDVDESISHFHILHFNKLKNGHESAVHR